MQFNGGGGGDVWCYISPGRILHAGVRGPTLLIDNSLNVHHLSLTSALLCAMTCPGLDKNNRH